MMDSSVSAVSNGNAASSGNTTSSGVARQRLKIMMDAEKQKLDNETLKQIQQEIGTVITKYVDIEPENIEVKVILKDYKAHTAYDVKRE